jgi:hypothetical protein
VCRPHLPPDLDSPGGRALAVLPLITIAFLLAQNIGGVFVATAFDAYPH